MEQLNIKTKSMDVQCDGIVTVAVNCIGVMDYQNDISESGSFDKTLKENFKNIRHYLNHNDNQLIGCPIEGKEENGALVFKSALCLDTELGRDTYALYKLYRDHGNTLQHSIGVQAIQRDKNDKRRVKEWKLWEFSTLTKIGACPGTHLIDIKSLNPSNALDVLDDALHSAFSDKAKADIEQQRMLVEKALKGDAALVTCDCGLTFDYNSLREHTMTEEAINDYRNYVSWMINDKVRDEVRKIEPQISEEVANLISSRKSLLDSMKYVYCPKCGRRIYRNDIIMGNSEPQHSTREVIAAVSTMTEKEAAKMILNKYQLK